MPLFVPGIPPAIISNEPSGLVGTTTITLLSGVPILYAFELQATTVILGGRWYMGATVTGTTSMGIYDGSGNLVATSDSGVHTNFASQFNTFTYGTAITLSAGLYYMALACSNATDTYYARIAAVSTPAHRGRRATNTLSAGALPATTGTLTTTTNFPSCALMVSGGLS